MTATDTNKNSFLGSKLPFYATVFLSAFLLFQVQPMIGKYILPWFGGGSSIWTTTILFFQLLLLVGYGYAYFITKLRIRQQVIVHSLVLISVILLLFTLLFFWKSPITPPIGVRPADTFNPVLQVLMVLTMSIGLPYFLLSTTSSLLQRWFSLAKFNISPYPLYSLSNAGSLLGLLTYPFIIEVFLPLQVQGIAWTAGFFVFAVLLVISAAATLRNAGRAVKSFPRTSPAADGVKTKKMQPILWIIFPMVSSMILLSTTNQITQSVSPAPFLWILPLGLYLLSFILIFSSKHLYWRKFYAIIFLIIAPLTIYNSLGLQTLLTNLSVYLSFIFVSYMLLHGELYNSRPEPEHLNLFYFLEALGSVIGGILIAIIAPLIFTDFWEFYIGIFLVSVIPIVVIGTTFINLLKRFRVKPEKIRVSGFVYYCIATAFLFGALFYFFQTYAKEENEIVKMRNFYGVITISSGSDDYGSLLKLYNGDISHGSQYLSGNLKFSPTEYYGPESGAGLAIIGNKSRANDSNDAMHIGVVGLGAGTLAAYGEKGDKIIFYEINPLVVNAASNYFSYLKDSKANVSVVLGDARLSMEKEIKEKKGFYNVLLIDAFTDDAIPVHLLTKEAFLNYFSLLNDDNGIVAIHISNKYLDLFPVIREQARHYNYPYAFIESDDDDYQIASASWVLLAKNPEALSDFRIQEAKSEDSDAKKVDLWTDDYSNLFQVIHLE